MHCRSRRRQLFLSISYFHEWTHKPTQILYMHFKSELLYLTNNQALKLLFLLKHTAQSLFPFFLSALLNLTVYVDESRAPLSEKPAVSPSLRVRIIPLKTSQILAPCSATLGLTTGGNYTFSHQTAHRPGREHTHAAHNS